MLSKKILYFQTIENVTKGNRMQIENRDKLVKALAEVRLKEKLKSIYI